MLTRVVKILCVFILYAISANALQFFVNKPVKIGQQDVGAVSFECPECAPLFQPGGFLYDAPLLPVETQIIDKPADSSIELGTFSVQSTLPEGVQIMHFLSPTTGSFLFTLTGNLGNSASLLNCTAVTIRMSVWNTIVPLTSFDVQVIHGDAVSISLAPVWDSLLTAEGKVGAAFNLAPQLVLYDSYGNVACTDSSHTISVSFRSPSDAQLYSFIGQTSVLARNGVATFSDLGILGKAPRYYYLAFSSNPPLVKSGLFLMVDLFVGDPQRIEVNPLVPISYTECIVSIGVMMPIDTQIPIMFLALDAANNQIPDIPLCPQNGTIPNGVICISARLMSFENGDATSLFQISPTTPGLAFLTLSSDAPDRKYSSFSSFKCNNVSSIRSCPKGIRLDGLYTAPVGLLQCFGTDFQFNSYNLLQGQLSDCSTYFQNPSLYESCMQELQSSPECTNLGYYFPISSRNAWSNFPLTINQSDVERLKGEISQPIGFVHFEYEFEQGAEAKAVFGWQWAFGQDKLIMQLDPALLRFLSFGAIPSLQSSHTIHVTMPYCESITQSMTSSFVSSYLMTLFSNMQIESATNGTSKIEYNALCFGPQIADGSLGFSSGVTCCDISSQSCGPQRSYLSPQLLAVLLLPFMLGTSVGSFSVSLFFLNFKNVFLSREDVETLKYIAHSECRVRRKARFFAVLVFPCVLYAMIGTGSSMLAERPNLLLAVYCVTFPVIGLWYVTGLHRVFVMYYQRRAPSKLEKRVFYAIFSAVIFISVWMLSLAVCWITLGVLLAPDKLLTIFSGIIVILLTLYMQYMKATRAMVKIQMEWYTKVLSKNGVTIEDPSKPMGSVAGSNQQNVRSLDDPDIQLILQHKVLDERVAQAVGRLPINEQQRDKILSGLGRFSRFRNTYILGQLGATAVFAVLFVSFVIMAVSAFTSPNGAQSTIGTALIALGGALGNFKSDGQADSATSESAKNSMQEGEHSQTEAKTELSTLSSNGSYSTIPVSSSQQQQGQLSEHLLSRGASASRPGTPTAWTSTENPLVFRTTSAVSKYGFS